MKRLASIAVLLLSASALAQTDPLYSTRSWSEAQALTRAAPTLTTEGINLNDVEGMRAVVCADSGQTLSGAGTLNAYVYDNDAALWIRNPALDVSVTSSAVRCQAFPDLQTMVATGRMLYAATAVTVSAGTVTVYIKAWAKRGPLR